MGRGATGCENKKSRVEEKAVKLESGEVGLGSSKPPTLFLLGEESVELASLIITLIKRIKNKCEVRKGANNTWCAKSTKGRRRSERKLRTATKTANCESKSSRKVEDVRRDWKEVRRGDEFSVKGE